MEEDFVKCYEELSRIPELKNGRILSVEEDSSVSVEVDWQCRNLVDSNFQSYKNHYLVKGSKVTSFPTVPLMGDAVLSSVSCSGRRTAYVCQDDVSSRLMVAGPEGGAMNMNLKAGNLHGKVYCDPYISSLEWSSDDRKLAFVAEKFRPHSTTFYASADQPGTSDEEVGEKYLFIEDWGEQMQGQHQGVVVIVDLPTKNRTVVELPGGCSPGHLTWRPHSYGVVGVAYPPGPYRIGIAYCSDRDSFIFSVDSKGKYEEITSRGQHVKSPRFSPTGSKLAYLRSTVFCERAPTAQLLLLDWSTRKNEVLLDYVNTSLRLKEGQNFFGVCGKSVLPKRCFDASEKVILFSAYNLSNQVAYFLHLESKNVVELSDPNKFSTPLDLQDNQILILQSTVTEPERLFISELLPGFEGIGDLIPVTEAHRVNEIPKDWFHLWRFQSPIPDKEGKVIEPSALYIGPTKDDEGRPPRPLICWPHGGPHSLIDNHFSHVLAFFVCIGYSLLLPNYRGSIGHGNDFLTESLGRCGEADVDDCYHALQLCLQKFGDVLSSENVFLVGFSHGGFLAFHLAAKHPKEFRALASINGATDIHIMATVSDIPEWAYLEYGLPFELGRLLDLEAVKRMHERSPITFADQIQTPTIFLLGRNDRRVPTSQGLHLHRLLVAREVPSRVYMYDDDHPLKKVSSESDYVIQIARWFARHS